MKKKKKKKILMKIMVIMMIIMKMMIIIIIIMIMMMLARGWKLTRGGKWSQCKIRADVYDLWQTVLPDPFI